MGIEPMTSSLPRMRSTTELREPVSLSGPAGQGRRDSNPQPPVLETGALPVELRPLAPTMAGGRFELPTPAFSARCSTKLSYPAPPSISRARRRGGSSGGGIRTHDLVVNSHPLWPLSYPGTLLPNKTPRPAPERGEA